MYHPKLSNNNFNPRSPHGERHTYIIPHLFAFVFQSTLPARGATRCHFLPQIQMYISIHAPRTGSDFPGWFSPIRMGHFNPRSPHGERRHRYAHASGGCTFQSTLPARGATSMVTKDTTAAQFQSTLPARGATTAQKIGITPTLWISIHAPRTGSDTTDDCYTPPNIYISIHAPRTGSDAPTSVISGEHRNFNPRSPHGERRDALCCVGGDVTDISIHAPRTGSDERREHLVPLTGISIHAPRTGSDCHKHMWD